MKKKYWRTCDVYGWKVKVYFAKDLLEKCGDYGQHHYKERIILIDESLKSKSYDDANLSSVLYHELEHATNHRLRIRFKDEDAEEDHCCFMDEIIFKYFDLK
jgi:hypothetical protein